MSIAGERGLFSGVFFCYLRNCLFTHQIASIRSFCLSENSEYPQPESDYIPKSKIHALVLGAIGVVFGDIGTSPLYAIRESFHGENAFAANQTNILGSLSLIFWSLMLIVSLKYVVLILRADNKGEGGILALETLARKSGGIVSERFSWTILLLGIFGSTLLYGDGIITPAISVLSALEGLKEATPMFESYVPLITIFILFGLFSVQKFGTDRIGAIFGPITTIWFIVLGLLGVSKIIDNPTVLSAMNPYYAMQFFTENGARGYVILGTIFLTVTGGEALYADMGHFGKFPIRVGWFSLVLPCLLLNYFGQGALLLNDPAAVENPFYKMVPLWALYPTVVLATMATVIASQALISGVFSLTKQAIQLGYFPRMKVVHTSDTQIGQIYVPFVNWALCIGAIWLVIEFQKSSAIAAAYGIAVSLTMLVTTILAFLVARSVWKWSMALCAAVIGPLILIDIAFFGSNSLKIFHGGWIPIVIACGIFLLMLTWIQGRKLLAIGLAEHTIPFSQLVDEFTNPHFGRVEGTAIYMSGRPDTVPLALSHNLKHNKVVHRRVILITFVTRDIPHVSRHRRLETEQLSEGLWRLRVSVGFMDDADFQSVLELANEKGMAIVPEATTFFLGREIVLATRKEGMSLWRERLFAFMGRNAQSPVTYYNLPVKQVMEVGVQIEI
ncbi:MAG: potassium transporter Kup [Proteobacteria bacterium]|nr:potassium transporter Kup [Pseudomonadota bacterium]